MRVGAVGRTRTGKTTLVRQLLRQQKTVVVVDTKGNDEWPGYHLTTDSEAAIGAISSGNVRKIVYRVLEGTQIPNEWWTRIMRAIHKQGGGVLYIDEMPMITTANFAPQGLKDVFRIGGGLGVGVWWSAQEATGISNTVIRQSNVIICFNNHGASDRDKLIGTVGDMGEVTKDLELYEFIVYRADGVYDVNNIPVYQAEVGT